jgi:hypothetical protein
MLPRTTTLVSTVDIKIFRLYHTLPIRVENFYPFYAVRQCRSIRPEHQKADLSPTAQSSETDGDLYPASGCAQADFHCWKGFTSRKDKCVASTTQPGSDARRLQQR